MSIFIITETPRVVVMCKFNAQLTVRAQTTNFKLPQFLSNEKKFIHA